MTTDFKTIADASHRQVVLLTVQRLCIAANDAGAKPAQIKRMLCSLAADDTRILEPEEAEALIQRLRLEAA